MTKYGVVTQVGKKHISCGSARPHPKGACPGVSQNFRTPIRTSKRLDLVTKFGRLR